jgi:hypothetical protein
MGSKRMKHLNELRVAAMAGDKAAIAALDSATYVPPHLRQPDPLGALHRKRGYSLLGGKHIPTTFKRGVHVTSKTVKAVACSVSTNIHPDYGFDRLQMLKDRRERRAAA